MTKPLAGADAWASAREERAGGSTLDTIDRVISRRVPADAVPPLVFASPTSEGAPPALAPTAPPEAPAPSVYDISMLYLAYKDLSGSALKMLVAIMEQTEREQVESILLTNSRLCQITGLKSNNTVITALRELMDTGWLLRSQTCPRCQTVLPETDAEKVTTCPGCTRQIPPCASFAVQNPHSPLQKVHSPLHLSHSPVQNVQSHSMQNPHSPLQELHSPVQNPHSSPVQEVHSPPLQKSHSYIERVSRFVGQMQEVSGTETMQKVHSPVQNSQRAMQKSQTPRARADSDSESNITNDSVYMGNGIGNDTKPTRGATGRSETEQMAQASCKALEDNSGSLGMHIKAWAHARQMDAKTGGSRHQTALSAIQRELTQLRTDTGQAQGKAWTRRVCDYFVEQGQPLPKATGKK